MKTPSPLLLGALALIAAAPSAAQQPAQPKTRIDSVLQAFKMPRTTAEARQRGVPDSSIAAVISVLKRDGVPAGDAQEILQREVDATAAGQPVDDFGAFVQEQHRKGLRGRALADAIHAEQARRGLGREDRERSAGEERGRPEAGRGKAAPPAKRRPAPDSSRGRRRPPGGGGQP